MKRYIEKHPERHHYSRRSLQLSKTRVCLLGVFIVALTVSIAQLVLANYYTTKGDDLSVLLQKKESLKEENDILHAELARVTSLAEIVQKAQAQGFVNAKATVYVTPQEGVRPVALESTSQHTQ